jgi:epoxyqueuosine reductase QueG
MSLKDRIKQAAYSLGADLVGVGDIGRCKHAPIMMSPQGLMPGAKSVIVMALHYPDVCIELGGESHPQHMGPYETQNLMNQRLDEMSYRLATELERMGARAIPIVSSNIWRYNRYKDLEAIFAPDVSHIYMAVVAGLAEIGFNGLAMTPEYGSRARFITVITDAELAPDPLIEPGSICDRCMLCREHCPTDALSTEIDGEHVLKIDDYEYRFPNKNLWRCAWAEHFKLDLDMEIPERVDEKVILEKVHEHGLRGGEAGQCHKYCLPRSLRSFDKSYSNTPVRKYANEGAIPTRAQVDRLLTAPLAAGADRVIVLSAKQLKDKGVDLQELLPGASSAVVLMADPGLAEAGQYVMQGAHYQMSSLCYDLTRGLEDLGARTYMTFAWRPAQPDDSPQARITERILACLPEMAGKTVAANTVVTRLALSPQQRGAPDSARLDAGNAAETVTDNLVRLARDLGADLTGITPAGRVDDLAQQLRETFEDQSLLDARDRSSPYTPWEPEISTSVRKVKTPGDWLDGARSVFVFALRYHKEVLARATRPPAEAVGPYSFETYVTFRMGCLIGFRLAQRLRDLGYRAALVGDLTNTASLTATPREPEPDLFSNRFVGLAAGLGWLTTSGHLCTPGFHLRQRVMALVTDAPLQANGVMAPEPAQDVCRTCDRPCIAACPSRAFLDQEVELTCEGVTNRFTPTHPLRCDWSKRYALTAGSGFGYIGSPADVQPPEPITPEALAEALKHHDPIKKFRPVVAEPCVMECPLKALD